MADGSDTTVVLADDFDRTHWFDGAAEDEDDPDNFGWINDAEHPTSVANVSGGFGGTLRTSTSGDRTNSSLNTAWHFFGNATWSAHGTYEEIFHRWYLKFLSGYDFGHEKLVAYHHDLDIDGQIGFSHSPYGETKFQFYCAEMDAWLDQNQGNNILWQTNHWYYVEVRIKLDTSVGASNGIVQAWINDCGTDGLTDPGAGTLRLSHTGLDLRRSNILKLGAIHQENWLPTSPPEYTGGGEIYNDQMIVRTQRIGPMGAIEDGGGAGPTVTLRTVRSGLRW